MKIWPFMIAASRYRDYQFVVCPDFVQSRGGGLALKNNIEMDDADPTRVRTVVFDDPKLGSIACAYSVGPIGDEGSAQTDSLGRVLRCASGVFPIVFTRRGARPAENGLYCGRDGEDELF